MNTTNMASPAGIKTPLKSPARRVLGNLTPRAINTPSKHREALERADSKNRSPLKQVQTLSPYVSQDVENMLPPGTLNSSRKRTIYEVDGLEDVRTMKRGSLGPETGNWGPQVPVTTAALLAHTGAASTDYVDEDDLTPTEPDTPEPAPQVEEEYSQETAASKESFSYWVNYDPCTSSQKTEEPPEPEKLAKVQAETLRVRLQAALYKVRTNQTHTPLSEIIFPTSQETPSLKTSTSTSTATSTSITTTSSERQSVPSITLSPAHREAPLHVVANLDPSSTCPKLLPGPVLLPTAYSSQMIHYPVPSSPPVVPSASSSPKRLSSPFKPQLNTVSTPVAKRRRVDEDEEQTMNEEEEEEETIQQRLQRLGDGMLEEGDLPSSVVKRSVASGLLELMNSR